MSELSRLKTEPRLGTLAVKQDNQNEKREIAGTSG
jgi:hypothetical protein